MKRLLVGLIIGITIAGVVNAESYLYIEQKKAINSSYEYRLPKLEWNYYKAAGKFFGNSCYYLSEFEGGLVYTAPRSSMFSLNHHSLEAEWHLGVEVKPFFVTYSLGARHYLPGNDDGITEGTELLNTTRLGISF